MNKGLHRYKDTAGGVPTVFVRMKGLEPPRLSAPDPKSGVATNYTTSASVVVFGLTGRKCTIKI